MSAATHDPGQRFAQASLTMLELNSRLDIYSEPETEKKTNIICTIGPACQTFETLKSLMEAGLAVARLNFSHGTHEEHAARVRLVRDVSETVGHNVAIALDTKGPEIRTGILAPLPDGATSVLLNQGDLITVTVDEAYKEKCTKDILYIDYKNLPEHVPIGGRILVADGVLQLEVKSKSIEDRSVVCTVVSTTKLGSRKNVNLPKVKVDLPAVSDKDRSDLRFAVDHGLDFVFASFIRKKADIDEIRAVLGSDGKDVQIIAKIENHEGVQNFDEIMHAADGIMVARGDLGTEIPTEKVFLAQKMMIAKCNIAGKPVICATQMLESMILNPRPTRAEASDVANAVIDGSDCVMLSGETASGNFPLEAVRTMANVCREAESAIPYRRFREELHLLTTNPNSTGEAAAIAAVDASISVQAKAIICLSITGRTARLLAKWRPLCPIINVTRSQQGARQCRVLRGVIPIVYPHPRGSDWPKDVDLRMSWALDVAKSRGIVTSGQCVIAVHGWQAGSGNTNTVRVLVAE